MNNIDWKALGVVHAGSSPEPRPTPEVNMVALRADSETGLELAEERAAIMEYDGRLSREDAEAYAFQILREAVS